MQLYGKWMILGRLLKLVPKINNDNNKWKGQPLLCMSLKVKFGVREICIFAIKYPRN